MRTGRVYVTLFQTDLGFDTSLMAAFHFLDGSFTLGCHLVELDNGLSHLAERILPERRKILERAAHMHPCAFDLLHFEHRAGRIFVDLNSLRMKPLGGTRDHV